MVNFLRESNLALMKEIGGNKLIYHWESTCQM